MSQGRSPSGVASLRARFEQNKQDNDTSPPSRGRSPAGSLTDEQSRPLNKIHTNFVAVEPHKNMSSNLEVPTSEAAALDGTQESKEAGTNAGSGKREAPHEGAKALPQTRSNPAGQKTKSNGEDLTDSARLPIVQDADSQGLGSILKGSPFEDEGNRPWSDKDNTKQNATSAGKQSPANRSGQKPEGTTNGATSKQSLHEKPKETSSKGPSYLKDSSAAKGVSIPNGVQKEGNNKEIAQDHSTQKPSNPKQAQKQTSQGKPETRQAPKTATKSHKMPPTTTATTESTGSIPAASKHDRRSNISMTSHQEQPARGTQANGVSATQTAPRETKQASALVGSKSAKLNVAPKPSDKATSTSTGFIKPRPKSPTKPVKLPSSATAPTAASAAKHDDDESGQTQAASRQSQHRAKPRGKFDALAKPTRTVRSSLPANSRPLDSSKPKARTSLAPGSTTSGSFLERMMRPTQSSAQKVHDKFEPTSPPRRNTQSGRHSSKAKRTSGGSVSVKSDGGEAPSVSSPAAQAVNDDDTKPIQALPLTEEVSDNQA